jgi:nicotinamide-nucleotide amidase
MLKIALVIIGNEVLQGKILEANLSFLARTFFHHRWVIQSCHIVPDHKEVIVSTLEQLYTQMDVVITSGGLGPTPDDLTKESLALYLKKDCVFQHEAYQLIQQHFARIKKDPPTPEHTYCFLPEGVQAIFNPSGLAPGLDYFCEKDKNKEKKMIVMLPGVPKEFQKMLTDEVIPRLLERFTERPMLKNHLIFKTRFVPEEKLFKELMPTLWDQLKGLGEVSSLPHILGVDVGIFLEANSTEELLQKETSIRSYLLTSALQEHIWHIGQETLAEVLVQTAKKAKVTFGFVESCTGGQLSSWITDIPGASEVFKGSLVTYQNPCKEFLLQIPSHELVQYGAVSEKTAEIMALKGKDQLQCDIVCATTGLTGPQGDGSHHPVGTLFVGLSSYPQGATMFQFHFQGDRQKLKDVFCTRTLHILLDEINRIGREKGLIADEATSQLELKS